MKRLLRLAIPVAIAHLGFITMGLIDLLAVREFGAASTGAVGIASSFYGWAITLGVGLLAGMDYYISTAFGAGRFRDCDTTLVQGLWLASIVGVPLTAVLWFASNHLLLLGVQPEVAVLTAPFLKWIALSMLPSFWFGAFRNYLQAINQAWAPLATLFIANVANFFLNFVFIHGYGFFPAMGFEGCAVATLSVRVVMVLFIAVFTLRVRTFGMASAGAPVQREPLAWRLHWGVLTSIVRLGLPTAGYMLLEVGVFGLSTVLAARLEPNALAAHQIVLCIASAVFMLPLGIGSATAVLVGQSLGQRKFAEARLTGWQGLLLGAGVMLASGLSFVIFSSYWLRPFTASAAVIAIGIKVLQVAALFQLADGAQAVLAGALRGLGITRATFFANLIGHWVFGLPLGLWLCFRLDWGVVGIWFGLALGLLLVALMLIWEWWRQTHPTSQIWRQPHAPVGHTSDR
jgi:multidrug resistance protein, MATE family